MNNNTDNLSTEQISAFLDNNSPLRKIFILETVDSTNSYAKNLAKAESLHEAVVVADQQTSGRGRLGREFFSPSGTGIYMSIILNTDKTSLSPLLFTVAAGVAVCRTIKNLCKKAPAIKWVNDIFLDDKKVCGILAESVVHPDNPSNTTVVVGIGLNVSTPKSTFPGKLKEIAGSVFPEGISRNQIIASILNEFKTLYQSSDDIIAEYKSYSLVLGKELSFTLNGTSYEGEATNINQDGNLIVRLKNGETITLKSGEVSLGSSNFSN